MEIVREKIFRLAEGSQFHFGTGLRRRASLACSFVEEDGGGGRGVKGFDARGHGDANAGVGAALDFFGEALAFVADQKSDGLTPVEGPGEVASGEWRVARTWRISLRAMVGTS